MNHVHLHCLILPGNREGMWLQSFRGSSAHNQLGHHGAYPEVWRWAEVEKMNWAIFYRRKSIASEQPGIPAAGAGRKRGEAPGKGAGLVGEYKDNAPKKRGDMEGLRREEGEEGQAEEVRGMRWLFLREFGQNHCIPLALSSRCCWEPWI